MNEPILQAQNLEQYFSRQNSLLDAILHRNTNMLHAVDGVSLDITESEVIGVIGESGCGKSTLLMTLMGLHKKTGGKILFKGQETAKFGRRDWKEFRSDVQMIFQNPFDSLDPKMTVREILMEPVKVHGLNNREKRIHDTLEEVELAPAERYVNRLPRELSGGEKQRVSIARALIVEPKILLTDEPVSMLDVSTQAAILRKLSDLNEEHGISIIYVSHDVSTVAHICEEINVMYLGRIVESGPTANVLEDPKHPYTQALINAVPIPDPHHNRPRTSLENTPGNPIGLGKGCRFRDRCPERMDICEQTPKDIRVAPDHTTACHLYYDHEAKTGESTLGAIEADGGGEPR